ncbi:DUF2933 domain-containing protein (plasmid) [Cupriavidus basilensis]|uniref:DUF2933 domain-containing protein n=1 Tax=unclassified Cupriavidus TaxID=2640874 RepID=UPI0010F8E7C9|nr:MULTISPECIES: DUF2933 domain-containing protein [unclassified Cupriavidus]MWL92191.1 DUF2933 domain-containing protein [Cupriavidus sp. SW-Y-13]
MKRNAKTMIAIGGALLAMLGAAYAVSPGIRALVVGVGPYLLLLLCPLFMWLMMKSISAYDDFRDTESPGKRQEPQSGPLRRKE